MDFEAAHRSPQIVAGAAQIDIVQGHPRLGTQITRQPSRRLPSGQAGKSSVSNILLRKACGHIPRAARKMPIPRGRQRCNRADRQTKPVGRLPIIRACQFVTVCLKANGASPDEAPRSHSRVILPDRLRVCSPSV